MLRCLLILPLLAALPAEAGLFKCRLPDGSVVYQQTACAGTAQGAEVSVDTRSPGGPGAGSPRKDYSVESQLKALESARESERKTRGKTAKETRQLPSVDTYDRAKCSKHRAQAAHWRQEVRNGYRNQEEKAHDQHMLEYHQALVDRYCEPE